MRNLASPVPWSVPGGLPPLPADPAIRTVTVPTDADRPVFVLTVARSGSTLLRFILDSHPDLACPPETSVGQACFGLARLWEILDPPSELAGRDVNPGEMPVHLTPDAAASIRAAVDTAYGSYVARRGKRRWCDKSLDSARMADLLANLYPAAQFVCLYRHCMDVIVSAIEAAPWGLSGYGFDSYVMGSPGNLVIAAARCWLDHTKAIIEFQDKHLERCHGVRYEDLVTDPEGITEGLFEFLGLAHIPGITSACFAREHDTRGPGDHKIWFTSQVSHDSLGQGTRVPAQMLPPELLQKVNETLDQLAYRQVDDAWTAAEGRLDPRADVVTDAVSENLAEGPEAADLGAAAAQISRRLAGVAEERARELAKRWPAAAGTNLAVAIDTSAPGDRPARRWALSYDEDSALTIRAAAEAAADETTLVASARTWLALLQGEANFAVELRAGRLRVLDPAPDGRPGGHLNLSAVTHLLAHLLGLAGATATSATPGPMATEASASPSANRNGRSDRQKQQRAKAEIPVIGR